MPRRGENVFHRKDGRWEARYVKEVTINNKKKYGSVYARSYREVKQKRQQVLQAIAQNRYIDGQETMEYYIVEWLQIHKIGFKPNTQTKYDNAINNYIYPYFKDIKLKYLSNQHIDQFTNKLLTAGKQGNPLAPKTVKDILMILKNIINYIENKKNTNFHLQIIYPKESRRECPVLTKKELIDLNQILLQDIDSCKFGILIAMTTGIRLGELCSLKWKNINLTDGYFVVNKTMQRVKTFADSGPKTKVIEVAPKSDTSNRQIPIPENLLSLFKKFQTDDDCYVLTGRSDEFMEPRRLEHRFKKYTRLAGIEKAHFHMLRHTFATFCIESGFELKSLSEVLGHSGSQVTLDRYVHSSFQLKKTSMNNFSNNFISGQ